MNLDNLLTSEVLTPAEEELLVIKMQDPILRKYLRILAMSDTKELLSLPALEYTDERLVKAHATIQGRLQTLATLQSIGDISQPQKSN